MTKHQLVEITSCYYQHSEYLKAVRTVYSEYVDKKKLGYAHYEPKKVFMDLDVLKQQDIQAQMQDIAGITFLSSLWHEWLHIDVSEQDKSSLLNNPNFSIITMAGNQELWKRFRGFEIYSDHDHIFDRFNETIVETIVSRFLGEVLKFKSLSLGMDYYLTGADLLIPLTQALVISANRLYQYYALSDFEGFATAIGQKLPGTNGVISKAFWLFDAIDGVNVQKIKNTQVCGLMPNTAPQYCKTP